MVFGIFRAKQCYYIFWYILNVFCEKFFGNKSLKVVLIAFLRFRDTENYISVKYIFITCKRKV